MSSSSRQFWGWKGSPGQTWSTVIFKSWAEDLPWGKEDKKKQPEQFEENQNQWEKGIFSRSNWSAVWNHSERSNTGKCPKKPQWPGVIYNLGKSLGRGQTGRLGWTQLRGKWKATGDKQRAWEMCLWGRGRQCGFNCREKQTKGKVLFVIVVF